MLQDLARRVSVSFLAFIFLATSTVGAAPIVPNAAVPPVESGAADSEFPSAPVPIEATVADVANETKFFEQYARANDYNVQWENLQVAPPGLPKDAMPADVFLLLEQAVFPKQIPTVRSLGKHNYRLWTLQAMRAQITAYEEALVAKPETAKPFKTVLDQKAIVEAVHKHVDEGRRVDTPLFIWERQHDAAQLAAIKAYIEPKIEYWASNIRMRATNPTDAPAIDPIKEMQDERRKAPLEKFSRHINWWDVTVGIQNDVETVKELELRDTSTRPTPGAETYYCKEKDSCTFRLSKDDLPLAVYDIPLKTLATYDEFVVFTHANAYDKKNKIQYLLFLDLKAYNGLIGNEEIPVFRLPVSLAKAATKIEMKGANLVIDDKYAIVKKTFEDASSVQQAAFNITANLVNPESWADQLPLVDGFQDYFSRFVQQEMNAKKLEAQGLEQASVLFTQLGKEIQAELDKRKANKPPTPLELTDAQKLAAKNDERFEQASLTIDLYGKRLLESDQLAKTMHDVQFREGNSRRVKARLALWVESLLSPRPNSGQKIKEALAALYIKQSDKTKSLVDKVLQFTADKPLVSGGVVAAAITAGVAPEAFGAVMETGLGVGGAIGEYLMRIITNFPESASTGAQATVAIFTDFMYSAYPQYIANDAWLKSAIGVGSFIAVLGAIVGVPHTIFNLLGLWKDLRKDGRKGESLVERFMDRQTKFNKEYFERIAADEGHRRNAGQDVVFSAEEEAEIQDYIKDRKAEIEKRNKRSIFGWFGKKKRAEKEALEAAQREQAEALDRFAKAGDDSSTVQKYKDAPDDFRNFFAAAKNFIFSQPALELTLTYWARIWNGWFGWRNAIMEWAFVRIGNSDIPVFPLKPRPISIVNRIIHPQFLSRTLYTREGRVTVPSEANGGLKTTAEWIGDGIQLVKNRFRPEGAIDVKARLAAVAKFEDQLIKAEDEIVDASFRAALKALPKFMKNKKDMDAVFKYSTIESITDKHIKHLSHSSQTFLRTYYESVYQDSMRKYLAEVQRLEAEAVAASPGEDGQPIATADLTQITVVPKEAAGAVDPEQERAQQTVRQLKAQLVGVKLSETAPDFHLDPALARRIADSSVTDLEATHFEHARKQAKKLLFNPANFAVNTKFGLATGLDPKQNPTLARAEIVNRRLKSPSALGRAVRQEIAKLKITTGMDLALALAFSAGIAGGSMKPIQDEMFGPNSVFYLSSTSFYMGFATGFAMGMMADAWSKMQADARQDDMGGFGTVPMGEDAEKGFLRWYWKQFTDKQNSAMSNFINTNKIIFWNIPAAVLNITLFNLLFAGRIDVTAFATMFTLGFALPFGAWHAKVDQAFERAVHYVFRGVKDEKWTAHPDVQKLLLPEMQRAREGFTWWNDIFWNLFGAMISNIEYIPTKLGPRGFIRSLFGGHMIEEYIINGAIDPLRKGVTGVPVVEQVLTGPLDFCRKLLLNPDAVLPGKFTPADGDLFKQQEIDRLGGGDL